MTTVVRQTGWVDWERNPGKRQVLKASSGGEDIIVFMDPNNSAPLGSYGDKTNVTKIYVYNSFDKITWTLRATILAPGGTTFVDNHHGSWTADLDSSDNIHILAKGVTGSLYYCKVTYGTWGVSAWETVTGSSGLTWMAVDMAVSEGGGVLVGAFYTTSTPGDWAGVKLFLRRTTPGTWAQVNQQIGSAGAGAVRSMTHDVSVAWTRDGNFVADTARAFAYAFCITTASNDNGVLLYTGTLNEQSGTAVTGHTLRGTYTAGDVSKTAAYPLKARSIMLFTANESKKIVLSTQTYYPKPKFTLTAWSFATGSWVNTCPASTTQSGFNAALNMGGMSQAGGGGGVTFFTNVLDAGGGSWQLASYLGFASDGGADWSSGYSYFNDKNVSNPYLPMAGTGFWANQFSTGHPVVYGRRYTSGKYDLMHDYVQDLRAPVSHTPAAGSVVTTSKPAVSLVADIDREYSQGRIRGTWYFATDAGFTSNLRIFGSDADKLQRVDGTGKSGKTVVMRDVVSDTSELFQGTWYVKAAHTSEYGLTGAFDTPTSFTVSHPPSARPVAPVGYAYLTFGTTGEQDFSWEFSDAYADDMQTAYQVVIERVDTGATLYDTGKVVSADQAYTKTFVVGDKNIDLRWKVKVWDGDDVAGDYSEYGLFTIVDPPAITFVDPVDAQVVTSALPTVEFTATVGGGRTLMQYRFIISQGGTAVYDSAWVVGPSEGWASGSTFNYSRPILAMEDDNAYTYQLRVVDSQGTEGRAEIQITTDWILPSPPDSITVDFAPYNTEDQGYMNVVWVEPTPDVDFRAWVVMRRDTLINGLGADLEVGAWTEVGRVYDESVQEFKDFYAPSGYKVEYDVQQLVDRFGDQVLSAPGAGVTVYPASDGYWFILPNNDSSVPDAFRLSNVTADSYTDEYEKTQFAVIDGGRKVDEGQHLGPSGSLTAQIRDSATQSARQKKRRLETMKELGFTTLFMRTPFGDMYRVYVNDLQVSRIAGVGTSEFCDITVPYMEVGE